MASTTTQTNASGNAASDGPTVASANEPSRTNALARMIRNLAVQDWLIVAYLLAFLGALLFGSGPNRPPQILRITADLAALFVGLLATRGEALKTSVSARSLLYRLTIFTVVFISYFQLQHILPAVSSRVVDAEIYALDLRLFGFEPALVWDRFVNPVTTEWFAFFYFGYFFVLIVHILPFLLLVRDQRLAARFSLGVFMVFCISHVLYMVVPGFGPYRFLAGEFQNELSGGTFWHLVQQAVTAGGAQKDIFPSLHTGAPMFFVFFSYRNRHRLPFKFTWPIVAFVASQIVIATMFLRWHYLIDICAGIAISFTCAIASEPIADWESKRRSEHGLQPVYNSLFPITEPAAESSSVTLGV